MPDGAARHVRERLRAIVGEVPIHLPRLSEVGRPLDEQRRRSERLESHDEMREVELRLEIQLNRDERFPVSRLPPATLPVAAEAPNDVLDAVGARVQPGNVVRLGVALETLEFVLQMAHDTVVLGTTQAARRVHLQLLLAADEKIAGCRIATALVTRRLPASRLHRTCNENESC